jgi:hypothetical protein
MEGVIMGTGIIKKLSNIKFIKRIKYFFMKRKLNKRREYTLWSYFGTKDCFVMEYRGVFRIMSESFAVRYFMVNSHIEMKNFGLFVKNPNRENMTFDTLSNYFGISAFDEDKISMTNIGDEGFKILKNSTLYYIDEMNKVVETTVKDFYKVN